jgi:hypothetical protein
MHEDDKPAMFLLLAIYGALAAFMYFLLGVMK